MGLTYSLKGLEKLILIAIFAIGWMPECISQMNTIKLTPVKVLFEKTNFSFERKIGQNLSAIADVQFWFLNGKERKRSTIFGTDQNPVLESNKGIRLSLELRRYSYTDILKKDDVKINFYVGFGGFGGRHDINMKRESYLYAPSIDWFTPVIIPEIKGDINLISFGSYCHPGAQFAFGKAFKVEIGCLIGKAWVNQKDDFLTLSSFEYYVLEEDIVKYDQKYSNRIAGFFLEPMINIGFSF